jgi:hypothetical protein
MIFHADMMLGIDADLKAYNHLKEKTVVCATRIEPPLHPNAGEKILIDFGIWPEEWKKDEFNEYVKNQLTDTKITNGVFAPWMMYKKDFMHIGGHDPILKSCREDSDVFNRMFLAGYEFIQPWNSLVYHLTGRGAGSFDGDEARHEAWKKEMSNSTKDFIRKWGSNVKHSNLMMPIVPHKRNIAFVVKNCNLSLLAALEPWCDRIYVDEMLNNGRAHDYIEIEQSNTSYDLQKRVLYIGNNYPEGENDVVVVFDANRITDQTFYLLQNISDLITDTNDIGEFNVDYLTIIVNSLETYDHTLIKL